MKKFNILEKFKKANRRKKLTWLLGLFPIIVGLILPITLQSAFYGIGETMSSIVFPNGFIKKNFNSTSPWIEYSFFMRNHHNYKLETFKAELRINFIYYEKNSNIEQRDMIFTQILIYNNIKSKDYLAPTINATSKHFDLILLQNYWENANFSKSFSYLMDLKFTGSYIFNLVSFSLKINDFNISLYEFPL